MHISIRLIFMPIFVCMTLLQGCSGARLQHKSEVVNELNKSAQAVAERQCTRVRHQIPFLRFFDPWTLAKSST